jgi:hypothetical protein
VIKTEMDVIANGDNNNFCQEDLKGIYPMLTKQGDDVSS